ncbi:MAG TPA: mechanosensitive ion channel family protein [Hydrogenophaga sp.]
MHAILPMTDKLNFDLETVAARLLEKIYGLLAALPSVLLALLVIWFAWHLGGWLSRRQALQRLTVRHPFLKELARTTTRWITTSLGILIALEIMGATTVVGAMLGTAGVMGIAIGFAFKETLENYLAGILMSLRQPFAPRDLVVIDGHEGRVVVMTSRATILMTPDGNHLRLPNALVFRSVMLNYTRNPSRRFEVDIGVGVTEDLIEAQRVGIAELRRMEGVMDSPEPRAFIQSLGDSNVLLRFHGWVDQNQHDFVAVRSEAIRLLKLALEEAGMDMPEPIYRVQLNGPVASTPIAAPEPSPNKHPSRRRATVDLGVNRELQQQIEEDRQSRDEPDMLDERAPRE